MLNYSKFQIVILWLRRVSWIKKFYKVLIAFTLCSTLLIGSATIVYAMDSRITESWSDWSYYSGSSGYSIYSYGHVTSNVYHYCSVDCTYGGVTKTSARKYGTGLVSQISPTFDGLTWVQCFFASVGHHTYYGFS